MSAEGEAVHEDLRLCRLELAEAREKLEELAESHAKARRARARAEREADVLAKALADVLHRDTRERARGAWRRVPRRRISRAEWKDVKTLRKSGIFRPSWYLRNNLDVAREGIDPALHFLRYGHREGRDPGPKFDVQRYLDDHPEVRATNQNPLLHFLQGGSVIDAAGST